MYKFENKSRMNTQEVSHFVVEMNELLDVTYKLDLRQCCIGTNTPKVVSEFGIKRIVYEPSTVFCRAAISLRRAVTALELL